MVRGHHTFPLFSLMKPKEIGTERFGPFEDREMVWIGLVWEELKSISFNGGVVLQTKEYMCVCFFFLNSSFSWIPCARGKCC